MLQNSLDRLFTGMAASLHGRVLPALEDKAVIAQVRAMIELLGNLSTRVSWDVGYLAGIRQRVRPALEALARVDGAPPSITRVLSRDPVGVTDPTALRAEVVAQLEALADGQAWLEGPIVDAAAARDAVTAFGDWYLDEEMSRLRSAGFGRPVEDP